MLNQEESQIIDERYRSLVQEVEQSNESLDFDKSFTGIMSDNINTQHKAAIQLRRFFSIPKAQIPYEYQKLTERLIHLSQQQSYSQLGYQSLCTLVKLAKSLYNHRVMADAGIVPLFISFIHHQNALFRMQAIWGLGYIARGMFSKDIGKKGLGMLLAFQKISKDDKTNQILLWALAHLLQTFRKEISFEVIQELLQVYNKASPFVNQIWIKKLIYHIRSQNVGFLFENGTILFMINNLKSQNETLVKQCLLAISKIVLRNYEHIDALVDLNLIENFAFLLQKQSSCFQFIVRILAFLISSRNSTCIKRILKFDIMLRKMLEFPCKQTTNTDVKMQLCSIFSGIIEFGDSSKLFSLYRQFNFVSIYLYQEQQPHQIVSLIRYLPDLLELGNKFKENGKNIFVQALINDDMLKRLDQYLCSEDEILIDFVFMIIHRFIDS